MKWIFILLLMAAPVLAADTTIKGGRMELVNKGETIFFKEGVRLDRGGDRMEARQMKTNRERDRVEAEGNVRLFRQVSSTETWRATGNNGFYDTQGGSGYLMGNKKEKAHVIHTEIMSSTSTRVVHIYGDRIDFFRDAKRALANGRVEGWMVDPQTSERYDFWSDRAEFDGQKKTIVLSGKVQPIVIQSAEAGRRTVKGDTIVYNTETKYMISEGNAEAVFEDREEHKKK